MGDSSYSKIIIMTVFRGLVHKNAYWKAGAYRSGISVNSDRLLV